MGTWGTGYFEDDAALDFMSNIEQSPDPKRMLVKAFDTAIKSDYLESDEGSAVIVAATYVDRQVNGTKFSTESNGVPLEVDTFPDRHPEQNLVDLKAKAVSALARILGENSEINELWAENDEEYFTWREGIQQLIGRLSN
jgi:hypothetical protein